MAKQQKRASAARRQGGNVRFMLIWGVTESANPYFKRQMFKKKKKKCWRSLPLIVIICIWYNHSQYLSAEKGDYKILYCHSSFFGWQTEQKICWIHSPACLLDQQVLNEVGNVNDRTIVQVNSEETLGVEPTCLIWRVRHETKAKSHVCDFPKCSIPQTSFSPYLPDWREMFQMTEWTWCATSNSCSLFFSGHDPNFTVSWCRAKSQKGSLCCCFFPNPVIIPPAALLQRFYLNAGSNCTESAAAQYKYIIILLNIPLLAVMCFSFPPRLWILNSHCRKCDRGTKSAEWAPVSHFTLDLTKSFVLQPHKWRQCYHIIIYCLESEQIPLLSY